MSETDAPHSTAGQDQGADAGSGDRPAAPAAPAAPPADDWSDDESLLSWKPFAGVAAVLAVIAVLAYVLVGGGSGDGGDGQVAGPGPVGATVADTFDRPDSTAGLGTTDTGQTWEVLSGTWGIQAGQARVVTPNAEGGRRSIAVVDLGSGNGTVSATAATMTNGWGLVFRYRGPFDYWMLQASTEFATYNLVKVVGGDLTPVTQGGIGLAKVEDGTRVGVQLQGSSITVLVNDEPVRTVQDPAIQNGTKIGMVVSAGGAADARWDDFSAQAAAPNPGAGGAGGAGAGNAGGGGGNAGGAGGAGGGGG